MTNEIQQLADTFEKVRTLTRWYLSLLKPADPYRVWEVNKQSLNSVAWLTAHLVWAEDFLIVRSTGGQAAEIPWLNHYSLKSDGSLHEPQPDMKMLLTHLKEGHEKALAHLHTLSDKQLAETNLSGVSFGGDSTYRMVIQHCIRHEAMHTGHLSWLCKINGISSI